MNQPVVFSQDRLTDWVKVWHPTRHNMSFRIRGLVLKNENKHNKSKLFSVTRNTDAIHQCSVSLHSTGRYFLEWLHVGPDITLTQHFSTLCWLPLASFPHWFGNRNAGGKWQAGRPSCVTQSALNDRISKQKTISWYSRHRFWLRRCIWFTAFRQRRLRLTIFLSSFLCPIAIL